MILKHLSILILISSQLSCFCVNWYKDIQFSSTLHSAEYREPSVKSLRSPSFVRIRHCKLMAMALFHAKNVFYFIFYCMIKTCFLLYFQMTEFISRFNVSIYQYIHTHPDWSTLCISIKKPYKIFIQITLHVLNGLGYKKLFDLIVS